MVGRREVTRDTDCGVIRRGPSGGSTTSGRASVAASAVTHRQAAKVPSARHTCAPMRPSSHAQATLIPGMQPGTPASTSYEGEGFVTVRHRDSDVVRAALDRIVQVARVEFVESD